MKWGLCIAFGMGADGRMHAGLFQKKKKMWQYKQQKWARNNPIYSLNSATHTSLLGHFFVLQNIMYDMKEKSVCKPF